MTQQDLDFTPPRPKRPSLTDTLEQHFRARAGQWVFMTEIAALVGVAGARQRLREVKLRGLPIERREWRDSRGLHHLAFRYMPASGTQKGQAA